MKIQPYLFFNGRAEEAAHYYRDKLGAEVVMIMHFRDSPQPADPALADRVMHMALSLGGAMLLGSDGDGSEPAGFKGFSLSLETPDDAAAERLFAALADGGTVRQPLISTFFSSRFGMVEDRFGVGWMVTVAAAEPAA